MAIDAAEIGPEKGRPSALRGTLGWLWTVVAPFLGLLLIVSLFSWLTRHSGTFRTADTWRTIAVQTVILGTAALGMTLVMIAGGIDLSVGSAVALVTVFIALVAQGFQTWMAPGPDGKQPILYGLTYIMIPAMVGGVLLGGLCGLLNGALITKLKVVPFIITLGSLKVFRGLAKWAAGSTSVYAASESKPWWFDRILAIRPKPDWLLVAPGVWILLGLSVLLALLLRYSLLGRYLYAVGSNEATARLCGVNVPAVKLTVYGLAGLTTGLAGVMQFVYMNGTGDPTSADGLELQVIAAVVIGGGSLRGGEGTVLGTLIGCLIMSVLQTGCVHAGISNSSQDIIIGAIIVGAVTLDQLRRGRSA